MKNPKLIKMSQLVAESKISEAKGKLRSSLIFVEINRKVKGSHGVATSM